ncbi:DUF3299 domain-containing protein [Glaciecola siphonariae]|uniref:DUF3299 domain-containing protein n=1 Tax=Glaciecola siphonariae TaxID=521012 RepID=A0ABV9LSN4_9ALTE
MKNTNKSKFAMRFFAGLLALIGLAYVYAYINSHTDFASWLGFSPYLYETDDIALQQKYSSQSANAIQWSQLLPPNEKQILQQYQQQQASTPTEFADNILLSLRASVDEEYSAAMNSINSVDTFDGKAVSIAGFIVPIDYAEDKSLSNIFIVPYYGACLHFPPPPPNQIIFAQLGKGFTEFELTQAYRLRGIMRRGLFEDPLGTSAYILDVVSIEPFADNPDDFRQH